MKKLTSTVVQQSEAAVALPGIALIGHRPSAGDEDASESLADEDGSGSKDRETDHFGGEKEDRLGILRC